MRSVPCNEGEMTRLSRIYQQPRDGFSLGLRAPRRSTMAKASVHGVF